VILADVFCGLDPELVESIAGQDYDLSGLFSADRDWAADVRKIGEESPDLESVIKNRPPSEDGYFGPFVLEICRLADMVFLGLHGENGENGKVQAAFDLMGIKYTGSGSLGSAIAMNKYISKQMMFANDIINAQYIVLRNGECKMASFGVPCVIKPSSGGSSVGVSIVTNEADYESAVKTAFKYENEVIVEQYIKGREFSVGVLGDTVLPPIEIKPKAGFYDYANKYQPGMTEEICPADLTDEENAKVQASAMAVFKALGLEVYGRIDYILNENNGEFYALEANSLPGMTGMSLLPQEAQAIGIDYPSLCDKIVRLSLEKYE
jgi:D-alanine-D-alanine ligase